MFNPIVQLLCYFIVALWPAYALCTTDIMNSEIIAGIELGVEERYDEAIGYFTTMQQHNPTHPAPHFFLATIWQTRMMDFESNQWRETFFAEIDSTIKLSENRLKQNPESLWDRFYLGSALSYKSFQISREKKYLSALNLAMKGIKQINKIIESDSSFFDAYIGVGSYLHWRSYMTRNFSWLPFFPDQRPKGIKLITRSFEKGRLSKWAAISNLAWIYIQEEQFELAIESAKLGLEKFPEARTFLWPLGDAQFKNGDFEAALTTYFVLLESVTREKINNRYNETVLHLKIAECFFALKDAQPARNHAEKVLTISPDIEVEKRLKSKKKKAQEIIDYIEK